MVQIFADLSAMQDGILRVGGSDYNHIRNVLRMRPGDELAVFCRDGTSAPEAPAADSPSSKDPAADTAAADILSAAEPGEETDAPKPAFCLPLSAKNGDGSDEYRFEIVSFTEEQVICRLRFVKKAQVELPVRVLLFQGLPKADKMDFIVQKAVEMGAFEIVPVEMHRSIVKLAGEKRKKRTARWQSIAEAAAKQSRRALIPQVHDILSMQEALRYASQSADVLFVPYERMAQETETGTRALLEALRPGQTAAVFIGPEGGFEESEVAAIVDNGGHTVSLGRRILRTETAALAFLSFLIYRFEL